MELCIQTYANSQTLITLLFDKTVHSIWFEVKSLAELYQNSDHTEISVLQPFGIYDKSINLFFSKLELCSYEDIFNILIRRKVLLYFCDSQQLL